MVFNIDLELREPQNCNFWQKYPKLMWDNGEEEKQALRNVFDF